MSKGMIEIRLNGRNVGKIALTPEGRCAFEYDSEFLKDGFSISPFVLPLEPGVFVADWDPFDGNFGVFDDTLPDGWGTLLLDRFLAEQGKKIEPLSLLERLSFIGTQGRGALEYFPDNSLLETAEFLDFNFYAHEAEKLLQSRKVDETSLETLYRYGGSSGGARPKVFVRINGEEWLVKFRASQDPENVGEIEYHYSLLAKKCGIQMAETTLLENRYFATKRFDRTGTDKIHTVSASGLLHASYRIPSLDYLDLFRLCHSLTKEKSQRMQLYRRMIFNVLIGNQDDHSKNFSFQFEEGRWKLAPAYDLLPSPGFNGQHTTSIGGKGTPLKEDLLAVGEEVGISKREALKIYQEIEAVLV